MLTFWEELGSREGGREVARLGGWEGKLEITRETRRPERKPPSWRVCSSSCEIFIKPKLESAAWVVGVLSKGKGKFVRHKPSSRTAQEPFLKFILLVLFPPLKMTTSVVPPLFDFGEVINNKVWKRNVACSAQLVRLVRWNAVLYYNNLYWSCSRTAHL